MSFFYSKTVKFQFKEYLFFYGFYIFLGVLVGILNWKGVIPSCGSCRRGYNW